MPTIYVERDITLRVAQDSNFIRKHFELENHSQTYSSLTYASDARRDMAASATINIDLGGITTGKVLFVESTAQLTIQIDTEDHDIVPIDAGTKAIHYHEGSYTSVSLINPDASNSIAEVSWVIAGV